MRTTAGRVLFALLLGLLAPEGVQCAMAQDASYPLQEYDEVEAERERERIIYAPGEADASLSNRTSYPAAKDTAVIRPTRTTKPAGETAKNSGKPASAEDDSILSFNFLYFIFEKYKLQDMVD
jgi:hypothetical protein